MIPRCVECKQMGGHKLDCATGRGDYGMDRRLPQRDPGRSIYRPDRVYKGHDR